MFQVSAFVCINPRISIGPLMISNKFPTASIYDTISGLKKYLKVVFIEDQHSLDKVLEVPYGVLNML
jgi:hypothetical protein